MEPVAVAAYFAGSDECADVVTGAAVMVTFREAMQVNGMPAALPD